MARYLLSASLVLWLIVDLNIKGKQAIVIGGGTEGLRKVKGLVDQDCQVIVISSRVNRAFLSLQEQGKITITKKKLTDASILNEYKNPFLVLAATNDKILNRKIVEKGRSLGAFVYAADDPPFSDFSYTSIINIEGIVQVAISTTGKSPIMARKIRIRAERVLRRIIKKSDIENARLQEFARTAAKSKIKSTSERKDYLYSLIKNENVQSLIKQDRIADAREAAIDLLNNWKAGDYNK